MKLIYAPEDGERREYIVKLDKFFSFDAELIEEVGGRVWSNWPGFLQAVRDEKTRAMRALLWLELRKDKPALQFAEVVTGAYELALGLDDDEIERAREYAASEDATDEERREIFATLGEPGKDEPSGNSEESTDSESPEPDSEV